MTYTISEIAEKMGVSVYTLRYYDKEGLLPDIQRINGRRVFNDKDLEWLKVLNCLKNTGMPIRDIREYLELTKQGDATLNQRFEIIRKQKQSIDDQIAFLKQNRVQIEHKLHHYEEMILKKKSNDGH